MVTTKRPHTCIPIDSLLGVRYIETDSILTLYQVWNDIIIFSSYVQGGWHLRWIYYRGDDHYGYKETMHTGLDYWTGLLDYKL